MSPTLMARVDGLPEVLLACEQIWPVPGAGGRAARVVSARRRARIERQTAVVHDAATPRSMSRWLAAQTAELERLEIRQDLAQAGLL